MSDSVTSHYYLKLPPLHQLRIICPFAFSLFDQLTSTRPGEVDQERDEETSLEITRIFLQTSSRAQNQLVSFLLMLLIFGIGLVCFLFIDSFPSRNQRLEPLMN